MTQKARITQAPAGGPGIALLATKKFYQLSYRGAPRTMALPGQPKDYGINPKASAQGHPLFRFLLADPERHGNECF